MEANDAGKASTLIAHLRSLPTDQVWNFLDRLPRADLALLWPWVPQDCRCPLRFGPVQFEPCPDHAPEACECVKVECVAIAEPCQHILEARGRDWPLPAKAVEYLLHTTGPREYADPRPPEKPSCNTNPRAQVAIMFERHRRRRQLWHPLDWVRDLEKIDERLTRLLGRGRNGADITGPLLLESSA